MHMTTPIRHGEGSAGMAGAGGGATRPARRWSGVKAEKGVKLDRPRQGRRHLAGLVRCVLAGAQPALAGS
jgi:hypothetical protein